MPTYESKFFGLRMQIPDGWSTRLWPDDGLKEFAAEAARWKPSEENGICFAGVRNLVAAAIAAPAGGMGCDMSIELQAVIQSDEEMGTDNERCTLKPRPLNGIPILDSKEKKSDEYSQEAYHYRFPRWKFAPGLWLYACIFAKGKARYDCASSIFETLTPLDAKIRRQRIPLGEQAPWTTPPSFYRMRKKLSESGPFYDLVVDPSASDEAFWNNDRIIAGRKNSEELTWTPLSFRRHSRARVSDCYGGPKNMGYTTGIFSQRAIDVLGPYLKSDFTLLPCTVNGKPHYYIVKRRATHRLDLDNSLVSRFDDGSIMDIKRYRLRTKAVRDPSMFAIAEARQEIFATASIRTLVEQSGLKGIQFDPVDGHGREFTFPG